MKERRYKRRREGSDGKSGGRAERGDTGARWTEGGGGFGGKEAESLGGSQAALSISVAEQSGLPAPLAMKTFPSPPPSPAPHPSLTAASSSPPLPTSSSHSTSHTPTFIQICYSYKDFPAPCFTPMNPGHLSLCSDSYNTVTTSLCEVRVPYML